MDVNEHAKEKGSMLSRYFIYLLISVYLIGAPSVEVIQLSWHDTHRIGQGAFLLMLWVLWCHRQKYFLQSRVIESLSNRLIFIGGIFFALGIVSAIMSQYMRWAFLEWAWLLVLVLSVLFIADLRRESAQYFDQILFTIISVACLIYLIVFLARYATIFSGISLHVWNLFHGFSNVRFFGQFQTMTLPLLALLIYFPRSNVCKFLAYGFLGGWWMLCIASGTRGTWLGLAMAMMVIAFSGLQAGRKWLYWQIAGICIGLVLYYFLFIHIPDALGVDAKLINRLSSITGLSQRDVLWGESWNLIQLNPFLGVGPMHFAAVPNGIGAHPHNAVLQIAAEWGMPAMLILLSIVLYGLYHFLKILHGRKQDVSAKHTLQVALFAALIAAATQSLVDGVIVMPYTQVTLTILIGWSVGLCMCVNDPDTGVLIQQSSTLKSSVAIAALTGILFIVIAWATVPEVFRLHERQQAYVLKYGQYMLPRFWQQGWIAP